MPTAPQLEIAYVNVGALVQGVRPKTKRALRAAVDSWNNGIAVQIWFDQTAMVHSGRVPGNCTPEDLKRRPESKNVILSVCGPDPYTDRRWYANVRLNQRTGKVTCS